MTDFRIVAAALNIDGLIITLPEPARHHDLIHLYFELTGHQVGPKEQGFLTSSGFFVDRQTAFCIALAAKQIGPEKTISSANIPDLFSEDLW